MVKICCIPNCSSNLTNSAPVLCFPIPTNLELRTRWISRIPLNDFQLPINGRICCKHFEKRFIKNDGEDDTGHYLKKMWELEPNAIPTIFEGLTSEDSIKIGRNESLPNMGCLDEKPIEFELENESEVDPLLISNMPTIFPYSESVESEQEPIERRKLDEGFITLSKKDVADDALKTDKMVMMLKITSKCNKAQKIILCPLPNTQENETDSKSSKSQPLEAKRLNSKPKNSTTSNLKPLSSKELKSKTCSFQQDSLLERTCRTCSVQVESEIQLVPIFAGESNIKNNRPDVFEALVAFRLGLAEIDGLPQKLCKKCIDSFATLIKFRLHCQQVQVNLRQMFLKPQLEESSVRESPFVSDSNGVEPQLPTTAVKAGCSENSIAQNKDETNLLDKDYETDKWNCEYLIDSNDEDMPAANSSRSTSPVESEDLICCLFCCEPFRDRVKAEFHKKICDSRPCFFKASDETRCFLCAVVFETEQQLQAHLRLMHKDDRRLVCPYCDKVFKDAKKRDSHIRTHEAKKSSAKTDGRSRNKSNECPIRSKVFRVHRQYEARKINVHDEYRRFKCDFCDKRFPSREKWEEHEQTHTRELPFVCGICGEKFPCQEGFQEHLKVHTGVIDFQCDFCEKGFPSKQRLRYHRLNHTQGPVIRMHCKLCDKKYEREKLAEKHMETVHGVQGTVRTSKIESLICEYIPSTKRFQPWRCDLCSRFFSSKEILERHVATMHDPTRQYECPHCFCRYSRKTKRNDHVLRVHQRVKRFQCEKCDNKFFNRGNLNQHMRTHTRDSHVLGQNDT